MSSWTSSQKTKRSERAPATGRFREIDPGRREWAPDDRPLLPPMHVTLIEAIRQLISPAQRILLITHVAPDGDAIGSLLAMGEMLRAQGQVVILACEDPVPANYTWLPGSAEVVDSSSLSASRAETATAMVDLVISLDCGDRGRMGTAYDLRLVSVPLLNVDHHVTNTNYGTLNWVDPSCAATTQMVLYLAEALGWELTEPVAVCLLTGLVTDTRSFRTSNVDLATLRAALRLMEAGASLSQVAQRSLGQQPLAQVRLFADAVGRVRLEEGILWTSVTRAMRRRWMVDEDGTSGLANSLSGVREAQVVVVFTERNNGTIDVGLRAVPGYDVARLAIGLGGGGHPQAAGCTLEGDLEQIQEQVLARVRQSVAEQRRRHADDIVEIDV